ncbi:MAG: hypothetical protein AB7E78_14610 [Porticoccaceae bacterium]
MRTTLAIDDDVFAAGVEPVAEAEERRANADRKANDLAVEVAQRIEQLARRSQIEMTDAGDLHGGGERLKWAEP